MRALEGFLNSLFKKMNLNIKCPNYTSISKRAKNLKIKIKSYHKRSISKTAMFRYKTLISRNLSFRNFVAQENEVMFGINVVNKMASLGTPKLYRIA